MALAANTYHRLAKTVMPPNMAMAQFMVSLSTGVARGKKQKTKRGQRKRRAMMLIARPYFPNEKRDGGRGSPRSRLETRQPIETM